MASLTTDYNTACDFLGLLARLVPDLDRNPEDQNDRLALRVYTTGWTQIEGVMVLAPAAEEDADLRVVIAARNERALRDLLLAVPSGKVCLFRFSDDWTPPALTELFDGRLLSDAFLGVKRGSGRLALHSADAPPAKRTRAAAPEPGAQEPIRGGKDPRLTRYADLAREAGRREHAQFVVEGRTLVERALSDGQPVESLLYTSDLARAPEGAALLESARLAGVPATLVSEGLMGKVTTTRAVPEVMAAIFLSFRDTERFHTTPETVLLIAENINSPDNLGMILRTADAAGVEGVVLAGDKTDPFHKNCLRAARGAVGRLPILACRDLPASLLRLRSRGFRVVGATPSAEQDLFHSALKPPLAVVVGNEQAGLTGPTLEACSVRVRIPMAPGQDSLNVGVAAGLMLYEAFRQNTGG